MQLEKTLPASVDCEKAVLAAILLDNSTYDQATAKLTADAFFLDSHRRIFLRMQELFEAGIPIDYNTLTEQLGKHGEIEAVGGTAYVMGLPDGQIRTKNITHYCNILLDKFISRQSIHNCASAIAAFEEQSDSGKRTLEYLLENLLTLQMNGCKQFAQTPDQLSDQVMANMMEMREKRSRLIGF